MTTRPNPMRTTFAALALAALTGAASAASAPMMGNANNVLPGNDDEAPMLIVTAPAVPASQDSASDTEAAITRDQVQDELMIARQTGTLTPSGEIGDTPEILAAREAYNELQAEVLEAQYAQAAAEAAAAAVPVSALPATDADAVTMTMGDLIQLIDAAQQQGDAVVLVVHRDAVAP